MNSRKEKALTEFWKRPIPNNQTTLFGQPVDSVLNDLDVSKGDLRRWKELGWVSFHVDSVSTLHEPEIWEIEFVRNLARSGLSISQIDELLTDLPKPYRFDPVRTVYHFGFGWVTSCEEDPFEVVDRELESWIDHLAKDGDVRRLRGIVEVINERIAPPEPTRDHGE